MASEANRRELEEKVKALVAARFGGDYRAAFDHYDADRDGHITRAELLTVLRDAAVGSWLTRNVYAKEAVRVLDTDADGGISWEEFLVALSS